MTTKTVKNCFFDLQPECSLKEGAPKLNSTCHTQKIGTIFQQISSFFNIFSFVALQMIEGFFFADEDLMKDGSCVHDVLSYH